MPSVPSGGLTPASAFTVVEQTEQITPPAILADAIDPATGEFVDLLSGFGIADGMVVSALRTQRGSGAAVREHGQRWRELTHADERSRQRVESMTREALQHAADAGVVRLSTVTAETDASDRSQVNHFVEYVDELAPPERNQRRLTFTE